MFRSLIVDSVYRIRSRLRMDRTFARALDRGDLELVGEFEVAPSGGPL